MEIEILEELEMAIYLNKIDSLLRKHKEGFENMGVSVAIGQLVMRTNTLSIRYEA